MRSVSNLVRNFVPLRRTRKIGVMRRDVVPVRRLKIIIYPRLFGTLKWRHFVCVTRPIRCKIPISKWVERITLGLGVWGGRCGRHNPSGVGHLMLAGRFAKTRQWIKIVEEFIVVSRKDSFRYSCCLLIIITNANIIVRGNQINQKSNQKALLPSFNQIQNMRFYRPCLELPRAFSASFWASKNI